MATIAEWVKIDESRVAESLAAAREKLGSVDGELVLDFAAVRRIDKAAVDALEKLCPLAEQKKVGLILRSVNVDVYKVLKLARMDTRFTFVA